MLREIIEKLSGTQVTIMAVVAMLVPGAVAAAVTFQPVTIVDPNSGKQSLIDSQRRLHVYDPVAGYRNNPANIVEIVVIEEGNGCESSQQYVVPAGKAFVITAISGYHQTASSGIPYVGSFIYDEANCTGPVIAMHVTATGTLSYAPVAVDFGVGILVKAGQTVSVEPKNNNGFLIMHGYLVPAAAIPALSPEETMSEPRPVTAAQVATKLKQLQKH